MAKNNTPTPRIDIHSLKVEDSLYDLREFIAKQPQNTEKIVVIHGYNNGTALKEYSGCHVLTLGEPVLQLLTNRKHFVRNNWGYSDNCFKVLPAEDNKLGIDIYPFPHQPSSNKVFYKTHLQELHQFCEAKYCFK